MLPRAVFPAIKARMKNAILLSWAMMVAVLAPVAAQAQKVNSRQARAVYEKADRALNEAWAAAKATLGESEFSALKEDQKAWVEYRDYLARSPIYTGADGQDELSLDSLADERTAWLRGLVREWGADETLTGVWADSYGGSIQIVEKGGKLHFIVECVRGPTSHMGGLSGIAVWNNTIGWFSDKGREEGKEEETNLAFVLDGRRLNLHGAGPSYYHGARAYFNGEYVKISALNSKKQAQVLQAAKTGELPEEP
jgi:uncharacterized protein YecT (DUF1311 family)